MSGEMLKNHLHSTVDRIDNRKKESSGISESKVVKKSRDSRNPKKAVNYIGRRMF